jgi:2-dehydropantoate 2-reductase
MHVVVGAGAVGLFLAARLSIGLSPNRVALLSRHLPPSRNNVLHYTPAGSKTAVNMPVRIISMNDVSSLSRLQHLRFFICNKAYDVLPVLQGISSSVKEPCSICVLSNGCLAILEDLLQSNVDQRTQDSLLVGTLTHGCRLHSTLNVEHTGCGSISIGLSQRANTEISSTAAEIAMMLNGCGLDATAYGGYELHIKLWEKLVINSAINPVTGLLRKRNAVILEPEIQEKYVVPLVREACAVMSVAAPELVHTLTRTTHASLEDHMFNRVLEVAEATRENKSSTLQDIERGVRTELDYISGFLLSKGYQHGLLKNNMPMTRFCYDELQSIQQVAVM